MNVDYNAFFRLPHTKAEGDWMEERLSTLSAKETILLAAAQQMYPPKTVCDAINLLASLGDYKICYPARGHEGLGRFYLARAKLELPELVLAHTDMEALGIAFEDEYPGVFVGDCYVMYPAEKQQTLYNGTNLETLKDDGWSVMVKLSSSAKPEGVWLRLPDSSLVDDGAPDESEVALHELGVDTFSRCKLLDARCIFPEAGNLMEQYDDPVELIIDGNNLGFLLDEQAQGMQEYVTKLVAAMEYEDCRTLKDVIGCADGIRRYSFLMADRLSEYARSELKKAGAPEMLIEAGLFDMVGFARDSLEQNGYRLDRTGSVYIKPREQEQRQEQDMPPMQQM